MSITETAPVNQLTGNRLTDAELSRIVKLAERQRDMEEKRESLENLLEKLREEIYNLSTSILPDAMSEIGLSNFTLKDGTKIEIRPFYVGKIPSEDEAEKDPLLAKRRSDAFQWLRDNGHGAIIKRELVLKFDKGKDKAADILKEKLLEMGHIPTDKTNVHHQTLKAFIKEEIESGHTLPVDLLGVHTGNVSKVTPAKQ